MHRKMVLAVFTQPVKLYSLSSIVFCCHALFVFAACGVCIPSFSASKRGSMSDLEKVIPQLMAAGKPEHGKELQSTEQIHSFVEETNPIYQTITAHQKVQIAR